MTQTEQVLEYMKTHGSINPLQAMQNLGIMRLSARIWDLKASGVQVETIQKKRKTPVGVKQWAEYKLKEPAAGANS